MKSLLLIANPAASGFTGGLHRRVVGILRRSFEVETAWPVDPEEGEARAREASRSGVDVVVAMGGDGVVHHVANGVAGTATSLGIVPAGTTNVLARILGIPARPAAAARLLSRGRPVITVPLAKITSRGDAGAAERYATFATGLGLDAEVVQKADLQPYRKYRFGGIHYARVAATVVLRRFVGRQPHLRVESGGRTADAVSVLVQIHTPYTYFGRFPLAVTNRHPERLAALVIEKISLIRVPAILGRALLGRDLDRIRGVKVWTDVDSLSIEAEPPGLLQADGESLGIVTHVTIEAVPEALRIIAPAQEEGRPGLAVRLSKLLRKPGRDAPD